MIALQEGDQGDPLLLQRQELGLILENAVATETQQAILPSQFNDYAWEFLSQNPTLQLANGDLASNVLYSHPQKIRNELGDEIEGFAVQVRTDYRQKVEINNWILNGTDPVETLSRFKVGRVPLVGLVQHGTHIVPPTGAKNATLLKGIFNMFDDQPETLVNEMAQEIIEFLKDRSVVLYTRNGNDDYFEQTFETMSNWPNSTLRQHIVNFLIEKRLITERKLIQASGKGNERADNEAIFALQLGLGSNKPRSNQNDIVMTDASIRVVSNVLKTLAPNNYDKVAVSIGGSRVDDAKRQGLLKFDTIRNLALQAKGLFMSDQAADPDIKKVLEKVDFKSTASMRYALLMIVYLAEQGRFGLDPDSPERVEANAEKLSTAEELCALLAREAYNPDRVKKGNTVGAMVLWLSKMGVAPDKIAAQISKRMLKDI